MNPNIPLRPLSFTLRATGLMREIITQVVVWKLVPNGNLASEKSVTVKALWDTGATGSVVTKSTAKELGLFPIGKARVIYGGNETDENVYLIQIGLPNHIVFPARVTECDDKTNFGLIIGMDIITRGDFAVTNKGGKTVVSYRVPSVAEIDFINETNKEVEKYKFVPLQKGKKIITAPTRFGKVNVNLPCPCGSGKKWKQCHGKEK